MREKDSEHAKYRDDDDNIEAQLSSVPASPMPCERREKKKRYTAAVASFRMEIVHATRVPVPVDDGGADSE